MNDALRLVGRLGVGLGYRSQFSFALGRSWRSLDFLEIIGDQCFDADVCDEVAEWGARLPLVCHFLGLSVASAEPLDEDYMGQVEVVLDRLRPVWFSDHLAVTRVDGVDLGHLTPPAFTEETVSIVADKVATLRNRFRLPFLLENITYPFEFPGATLSEAELLTRVIKASDCGILLDLTNLHVNSSNNGYDPYRFLDSIPLDRVGQVHLGGAILEDGTWIDSHAHPVPGPVFDLLGYLCERTPVGAVLLERDRNLPELSVLLAEIERARAVVASATPPHPDR